LREKRVYPLGFNFPQQKFLLNSQFPFLGYFFNSFSFWGVFVKFYGGFTSFFFWKTGGVHYFFWGPRELWFQRGQKTFSLLGKGEKRASGGVQKIPGFFGGPHQILGKKGFTLFRVFWCDPLLCPFLKKLGAIFVLWV